MPTERRQRVSSGVPGTNRDDFLALLDRAIRAIGRGPPYLCGSIPFDPGSRDRRYVRSGPYHRLIVQMEGTQRHTISVLGKHVDLELTPYQSIYLVPGGWDIEFSDSRGRALGSHAGSEPRAVHGPRL